MKKLSILLITVLAVVGALLIYNHFDKKPEEVEVVNKFASEYTLLDENNIYVYKNIDEILNIYNNGTGIIFMCTPSSAWCQKYAYYLNKKLVDLGVKEINYIDIKGDRDLGSIKYQRLLEVLDAYLYKDDQNVGKIYMPNLSFVKNGNVIANDNETSLVQSDGNPDNYWTEEAIQRFDLKISEYYELLLMEEEGMNNE